MNIRRPVVFVKDPDSILDYRVDWSVWMAPGDFLVDAQWIVTPAVNVELATLGETAAVVWLAGAGAEGTRSFVTNRVTTNDGRVEDYSFIIVSKEK